MQQQQEEFCMLNPEELLQDGGIPRNLVHFSKIEIDHFLCPICLNIIWKPVACAQDRCFQSFCESCIIRWINQKKPPQAVMLQIINNNNEDQSAIDISNEIPLEYNRRSNSVTASLSIDRDSSSSERESVEQDWQEENMSVERVSPAKCPKCKRTFKQTSIPIIHNLLEAIEFKCIHIGCETKPKYEQFFKHIMNCEYRKITCNGCHSIFQQSELSAHQQMCEFYLVKCKQCNSLMMRKELMGNHTNDNCIQKQFEEKDLQIQQQQEQLNQQKNKIIQLENRIEKISKGDFENINEFQFKTSFTSNYLFSQGSVKLVRNSYNTQKQKNDFLHFYLNVKIKTQCLIGQQWRIKIVRLQGHLLLGICSSLCHHSIDFIINRLGEVKKKEWNENKYKQLRKVNFTFNEGDILLLQFIPFQQQLRIYNETKHLVGRFECSEMVEMGDSFYCFFSLEQAGDILQFI